MMPAEPSSHEEPAEARHDRDHEARRDSTTPTMCMASFALPGRMSLNSGARYFDQSLIITSANLSIPKRIGATTKVIRSSVNACAAGSVRSTCGFGIGIGRNTAAMALLIWRSSFGDRIGWCSLGERRNRRISYAGKKPRLAVA